VALRRGSRKWIEKRDAALEVYDLRTDPRERRNLADAPLIEEGQEGIEAFRRQAEAHRQRMTGGDVDDEVPTLRHKRQQRLRAPGYVD
jgi:hypothetical protein